MRKKPDAWNARCLAGVLLTALASAPLCAEDAVEPGLTPSAAATEAALTPGLPPATAGPGANPASAPAAALAPLAGPLSVSLGAEALLTLSDGWHWVPKAQLSHYLAATGRHAGAWDLGIALSPADAPQEFRLQFEPMGLVEEGAPEAMAEDALLARVQERAALENSRHRQLGQVELDLNGWALTPVLELDGQRLVWAEHRVSGGEERLGWHGRFRLRGGVVKLDILMPPEQWDQQGPPARALFEGLAPLPGQGLADRQADDRKADLDLVGLVMDGVFGRGALAAGPPLAEDAGLGPRIALWSGVTLACVAAALWGWRRLQAWRLGRLK